MREDLEEDNKKIQRMEILGRGDDVESGRGGHVCWKIR